MSTVPSPQPSGPQRTVPQTVRPDRSRKGERGFSGNPYRGEASLTVGGEVIVVRPSFAALVAAEEELGPLFALVERAAAGRLGVGEMAALFDHLSREGRPIGIDRARIGEAIVEQGLAGVSPQLRQVLGQILQGR